MNNLFLKNYQLSAGEITAFPIISPYGLRHLRTEGAAHKIIGIIELFPLLGPVVSIVDVIANKVFRQKPSMPAPKPLHNPECEKPQIKQALKRALQSGKTETTNPLLSISDKKKDNPPFPSKNLDNLHRSQTDDQGRSCILRAASFTIVWEAEGYEGVVFKMPRNDFFNRNSYEKVTLNPAIEKAREICDRHDLFLLKVPHSEINDRGMEIQEAAPLNGRYGFKEQKDLYAWILAQPELNEYCRELFRQLAIFIAEQDFSDVKFDNIPIGEDGRVWLVDLDKSNALRGFTSGGARKRDGLFNIVPLELLDDAIALAKKHYRGSHEQNKADTFDKKLDDQIKEIRQKRTAQVENREKYAQYLIEKNIKSPTQPISSDTLPKAGLFAKFLMKEDAQFTCTTKKLVQAVNRKLAKKDIMLTAEAGRKVRLTFENVLPKEQSSDKVVVEKALKKLQNLGLIHKYKVDSRGGCFIIKC